MHVGLIEGAGDALSGAAVSKDHGFEPSEQLSAGSGPKGLDVWSVKLYLRLTFLQDERDTRRATSASSVKITFLLRLCHALLFHRPSAV